MFLFYTLLGNKIRFHCDSFRQNPLFFLWESWTITLLYCKKTIKTNWNFALSIRNFTLRLA